MKASEANLISWKLVIDSDNKLVTELSSFPEEEIGRFQKEDRLVILKAIQEAKLALEPLHKKIEVQLDAVF
jgi:hypothetical protein|tara:strand:- start:1267 stop:1479 length:213 start_codon:yes stop_codon:yes gene_type:complete